MLFKLQPFLAPFATPPRDTHFTDRCGLRVPWTLAKYDLQTLNLVSSPLLTHYCPGTIINTLHTDVYLCFWEPPRTWAQVRVPPASHTVAVQGSLGTAAAPARDKDPRVAFVQQGSWGSWGWAVPCSPGSPALGSPEPVGSLEPGSFEPGSPQQRGCTEGAGQSSSLTPTIT